MPAACELSADDARRVVRFGKRESIVQRAPLQYNACIPSLQTISRPSLHCAAAARSPTMLTKTLPAAASAAREATRFKVLGAISFSHFLNDMIQSLILAIYPLLKNDFALSFAQIGLITLTYQLTASVLQPFIGMYTDRYPQPRALAIGMGFTLLGLLLLAIAPNYGTVII